ncbi:chromosome partitioning protein ParB [Aureimonas endophytica]|uniref:Chromosome partitioning protein ParB n=1 Tax=Aureimonas endophytica TaxID=2027858 RepID=A0A916ZNS8_9HYPH|nr:ParB/RepB/Spo0J family partition protein [Aureimonas endophytica]GGE06833.1 chromosome partitioning protein ParB [Aureimonas endophytica]
MTEDRSRQRLGRGLASLIGGDRPSPLRPGLSPLGPAASAAPAPASAPQAERHVAIDALGPNPRNPRRNFDTGDLEELTASIRAHGIVQPILVRPMPGAEGRFEIVAGERRWRAAKAAALKDVPIVLRSLSDRESLEIAIIENVQRSDLNAIEEAEAYRMLIDDHGYTQADLADALGKSRSHVANMLRLLKLPETVRRMVTDGALSAGHARTAVTMEDPEGFARRVAERGLTVREAEELARREQGIEEPRERKAPQTRESARAPERTAPPAPAPLPPAPAPATPAALAPRDPDTVALETILTARLGMPVSIDLPAEGGRLSIGYGTLERLDELCRLLQTAASQLNGPRIRSL